MDEEALVVGLALGIAVGKRLERGRALVLSVANRGEEQRLQHPWARAVEQVRAGDEHRVIRRGAARQLVGAREERDIDGPGQVLDLGVGHDLPLPGHHPPDLAHQPADPHLAAR